MSESSEVPHGPESAREVLAEATNGTASSSSNDQANTNGTSPSSSTPKSKSGWDGKLRVGKQATLANPEALEDSDYSDDDAPPVDQIDADEDLLDGEDPDVEVWRVEARRPPHD